MSAFNDNQQLFDAAAIIPDLRASLCHSIMAAGFLLINLQNPYRTAFIENALEFIVMLALPLAVFMSWSMFFRRFRLWQKLTAEQQACITRTPESLRSRAITHLIMALLAAGLTLLGYVGHSVGLSTREPELLDSILVAADAVVAVIAVATAFRAISDILAFFRFKSHRA